MKSAKEFSHINTYAQRPPLRLPPIAEKSNHYLHSHPHSRPWDWREYSDFQCDECADASHAACGRSSAPRSVRKWRFDGVHGRFSERKRHAVLLSDVS